MLNQYLLSDVSDEAEGKICAVAILFWFSRLFTACFHNMYFRYARANRYNALVDFKPFCFTQQIEAFMKRTSFLLVACCLGGAAFQ